MLTEDWIDRWQTGRTGWHEPGGNAGLRACWPNLEAGSKVLVPLCGKSPDLLWLAGQELNVTGVELSLVAVETFFAENELAYSTIDEPGFRRFVAKDWPLEIVVGDYFDYTHAPFDALYDRGALVAMPASLRQRYVDHTRQLLGEDATRLIITLEYDQEIVDGPPFAVLSEELDGYWQDLVRVLEKDDIDTCPPKFKAAGVTEIKEVIWLSDATVS